MSAEQQNHNIDIDGSGQRHWLKAYGLRVSTTVMVAVAWAAIFLVVAFLDSGSYIDATLADPLNFKIRDALGRGPSQDKRLKIYAIDDRTFAMLGTPMPGIELWADILDSIASKKPKLIAVDAMFSARPEDMSDRARRILTKVQNSGVPVVTGAFVSKDELQFKHPLLVEGPRYELGSYLPSGLGNLPKARPEVPPWPERIGWHAYGPTVALQSTFRTVGHFQLFDQNKAEPFIMVGHDRVIPHISMYAADSLQFRERNLIVNDHRVAMDRHGAIPVNFINKSRLNIHSMMQMIVDAKDGYMAETVEAGDVVLILPLYFTGNVDLRPSPYGWIPGGLYLAAMFNSVLTGEWLQPVLEENVLIILLSLGSAFAAYALSSGYFWLVWLMTMVGFFGVAQAFFAYGGLVVPYVLPLIAGTFAGAHIFALKVRSAEMKAGALRAALDGAVSPAQMEAISRRPDQINLEPRERIVTLMFIDIVGFSLSSENMLPRLAFNSLKHLMAIMSDVIHSYDGVIDKTLGDGLLCYFGYRFDTDLTDANHPEKALRCAMAIQDLMLTDGREAVRLGSPIYPLRIGINTASCYLGDLGSGKRIEFTVVGNGVNYAKRLEAACPMYNVMIGSTTFDLVKGIDFGNDVFTRKMIKIKHHKDLMDAYEVNALKSRQSEREEVMDAFRLSNSLHRDSDRMTVKDSESIVIKCPYGNGHILNFNGTGISALFKTEISRGSSIEISFESRVPGLAEALKKIGMEKIEGEVRWSYTTSSGVAHGILFRGISVGQQTEFARLMTEFAFIESSNAGGEDDGDSSQSA